MGRQHPIYGWFIDVKKENPIYKWIKEKIKGYPPNLWDGYKVINRMGEGLTDISWNHEPFEAEKGASRPLAGKSEKFSNGLDGIIMPNRVMF